MSEQPDFMARFAYKFLSVPGRISKIIIFWRVIFALLVIEMVITLPLLKTISVQSPTIIALISTAIIITAIIAIFTWDSILGLYGDYMRYERIMKEIEEKKQSHDWRCPAGTMGG